MRLKHHLRESRCAPLLLGKYEEAFLARESLDLYRNDP